MKYILILIFSIAIGCILGGIIAPWIFPKWQGKLYGAGTLLLFFIGIPLFLWHRYQQRIKQGKSGNLLGM